MESKSMDYNSPVEIVHNRRIKLLTIRGYRNLFVRFCITAVTVWILFTQVFLIIQCEGQEMFPAVKDGDLLFVYRLYKEYRKGDVVLYQTEGRLRLGRVVVNCPLFTKRRYE